MSRLTILGCTIAALAIFTVAAPEMALAKHVTHKTSSHSSHKSSKHGKSSKGSKSSKSRSRRGRRGSSRHEHESASRSVPIDGASGRVVDVAAGGKTSVRTYTVKKSQGLDAVSRETGVDTKELAELNHLKEPYHLKLGQKLKVGSSSKSGKSAKSGGHAYVVARGDTLSAVAERFKVSTKELASLNKLGRSKALRPGSKLTLPEDYEDTGAVSARLAPSLPRATDFRQIPTEPGQDATLPPVGPPSQTTAPPLDLAQVKAAGEGKFAWPVNGKVVQSFGSASASKTDDGINVATPVGTPVKAAAGGTVIFAGKQIAAFGNYVLLQHDGGFLTAYGHLDRLNVKIGQHVSQGEELGQSGQTGQAEEPQLHFEILYAARREDKSAPVDPMSLLPPQ
jgi:murein DD-endopeptidase MepM/ murein hydrolase activator NlpD